MFITMSDITGQNLYVIPIVPADVNIKIGGQNETLNTVKGDLRLIGDQVLKEISWSSVFPVLRNYNFVATGSLENGYEYIDFIKSAIEAKIPVRLVITSSKKRSISNDLMTIDEGFTYYIDKAGDIKYTIKLTEFPAKDWNFENASPNAKKYLKTLAINTIAKKVLSKCGLI